MSKEVKVVGVQCLGSAEEEQDGVLECRQVLFEDLEEDDLVMLFEQSPNWLAEKRPDWVRANHPEFYH